MKTIKSVILICVLFLSVLFLSLFFLYSCGSKEGVGSQGEQGLQGDIVKDSESDHNGTDGLEFYLLDDGTYAVSLGNAKYLSNIIFPSSYKGKTVTRIVSSQSLFAVRNDFRYQKTITIPDTITHIEDFAFEYCVGLKSIKLPSGLLHIGERAFYGCSSLSNIVIPDSVVTIGDEAFGFCTALKKVSIPNSITDMGNDVFVSCNCLELNEYDNALYLGNENNPYVFLKKVKSKDILNCNINSGTKYIESYAFSYCKSISAITLPEGLISIGSWAFRECYSLEVINIPESVMKLGEAILYGCSSLVYNKYNNGSYLGNDNNPYILLMKGVNDIHDKTRFIHGYAFSYNYNLESITIPNSVIFIDSCAFEYCRSLKKVIIPDSVKIIGYGAFQGCSSLPNIYCEVDILPLGWNYSFISSGLAVYLGGEWGYDINGNPVPII